MPQRPLSITAVVLAGGQGRRMGGVDKGLVDLAGTPLVEHVLERIAPQVDEVLISANRNLERYRSLDYPVFPDPLPDSPGPLAGLLGAFAHTRCDLILTVPCDAPLLPADLAARTRQRLQSSGASVCSVTDGQRVHAAFILASRAVQPQLQAYLDRGERRVQGWLAESSAVFADFSDQPEAFININDAAALQALERRLEQP